MTKKEYIIKILDLLIDSRSMARDIKSLIQDNNIDDTWISALYDIISKTLDSVSDQEVKAKLQKSMDFLTQLKEAEAKQQMLDAQDIARLDQLLETI